jgi:hypothetical protein
MAGSIADFKASFNTDLARPSRFDVNVPIPIGLLPYREIGRTLKMRCENAELPGRSISTTSMKIYGVEEKFPYQTAYNDISLTFIVGDDMSEKKFFDAWLNWINPTINYNLQYKADYAVPLTVNQYDVKNQLSYSVTMLDAFPIAMNQLDLDWSSDGHHKLTITFAYTSWRNNTVEALGMELLMTTIAESPDFPTYTLPSNLGRDLLSPEQSLSPGEEVVNDNINGFI